MDHGVRRPVIGVLLFEFGVVRVTHPVLSHRDCFGIECVTLPGVIPPLVGGVIPPEPTTFCSEVYSGIIHACETVPVG